MVKNDPWPLAKKLRTNPARTLDENNIFSKKVFKGELSPAAVQKVSSASIKEIYFKADRFLMLPDLILYFPCLQQGQGQRLLVRKQIQN